MGNVVCLFQLADQAGSPGMRSSWRHLNSVDALKAVARGFHHNCRLALHAHFVSRFPVLPATLYPKLL